ncbi:Ig-like domain-containing protein [Mycobacterium sp. GA-2829]|uniref:Ig-like domain-containing protein n=1 Tax=Mycobacterium sp. GA-2829 TaxID=1772283 RepID=UPI0007402FD1|nr:Ig-like domain-containing protein [Mycobacterium sp. GA-2829]KUI26261.1 hypothetical protein AU194_30150 [Mycobacterium sp. GA-2829]
MAVHRRARRAEGFAVRRWLQLGAASAGVGAGLLGFSLMGPQVGTAAADTAGESTTSSGPAEGASTSDDDKDSTATDSTGTDSPDDDDDSPEADDTDEADDLNDDEPDETDDESDEADELTDEPGADEADLADAEAEADETQGPAEDAEPEAQPHADTAERANLVTTQDDPPAPAPHPRAVTPKPSPADWSAFTGQAIDNWTGSSQGWINSLPVDGQAKYHLSGALWATRRTLFNQAPTVAPIQISGKLDGPVTGTVRAVDPDGDRLIYVVTRGPKYGSVQVNSDGTYTYTPGEGFEGVDTFRVVAIDVGPHLNLVDPFRPIGARADNLINQRAIKFEFTFVEGTEYWTPERVHALRTATDDLIVYFLVTKPVVLTYDVRGMEDPISPTLASAGSDLISDDPGFWPTVVQHKLLTGVDANGSAADGRIRFNFGNEWALGDTVGPDEFDFNSTAVHELLHSFGFLSYLEAPGQNGDEDFWTVYDSFLVTRDREDPFNRDGTFNVDYDPYLIGVDGGLYFGGVHAVAAYGGLVPVYSPGPWRQGSSISHLDDDTFSGDDQKVMNANTGTGFVVRVLSPVELGILRDLGYRVDPVALL